jgi:hypothetical protein
MNPEQQLALNDVLKGENVFITGGAGARRSWGSWSTGRTRSRSRLSFQGTPRRLESSRLLGGGAVLYALATLGTNKVMSIM